MEVAADRSGCVGESWQQRHESTRRKDSVNNHQSTIASVAATVGSGRSSSSSRHAAAVAITTSCDINDISSLQQQQQQRLDDDDDDAMTDTWPLDLWADLSLPHIDSDVSDSEECSPFYFSEIRQLKSTTPVTPTTSNCTPRSSVNDDSVSSSSENNQQTKPIIVNQGVLKPVPSYLLDSSVMLARATAH